MGLIDSLLGVNLTPEEDRLLIGGLTRYGQFEMAGRAGNYLLDKLLPSDKDKMEKEDLLLDIAMKKKALGIDEDEGGSKLGSIAVRGLLKSLLR